MSTSSALRLCLWFDGKAAEAADFYTSFFKNSKIVSTHRYPDHDGDNTTSGREPGAVMTVVFELDGQRFMGLNGGPAFKPNQAISLMVECEDQDEIDYYWDKLGQGEGAKRGDCGWTQDKYGFWWQVCPRESGQLMGGSDAEGSKRAMAAMMKMKKLDIAELRKAYEGK